MSDDFQESFGIQWQRFAEVQLDSRNGTTLSRERILLQSGLTAKDFEGKDVLEVGCGSGRFTEILLSLGARVVALDYSVAVDACADLLGDRVVDGRLVVAQGDVFALPVRPRSFDIVLSYGVLQHTGAPERALEELWSRVAIGGVLLVDRYQLDLRHVLPFKYALRPILRRIPPLRLLRGIELVSGVVTPVERMLLRQGQGMGWRRLIRYAVGRLPLATYALNLEIQGRLSPDIARRWTVLETFDQYAPRYDSPATAESWRRQIAALEGSDVIVLGSGGQGNYAAVRRIR